MCARRAVSNLSSLSSSLSPFGSIYKNLCFAHCSPQLTVKLQTAKMFIKALLVAFAVGLVLATDEKLADTKAEILLVDDIEKYKEEHPGVVLVELDKPTQQPRVGIRYTLGNRIGGDGLVAQKSDYTSYAGPRDVQLVLTYPTSGSGAVVTYVQVDVNQSTNLGRGYVAAGGIGQRFIQVVIEARGTTYFQYNALIYGRY